MPYRNAIKSLTKQIGQGVAGLGRGGKAHMRELKKMLKEMKKDQAAFEKDTGGTLDQALTAAGGKPLKLK